MTNVLLVLICLLLAAVLGSIFGVILFFRRKMGEYEDAFTTLITPPAEGKPSPLASYIDAASSVAARAIVAQAVGTLRGMQSGMARAQQAEQLAMNDEALGSTPLGGLVGQFLPKSLRKNAQVIDGVLSLVGGLGGNRGGNNHSSPSSGSSGSPKFKL